MYGVLYLQVVLFESQLGCVGGGQVFVAALRRVLLASVAAPSAEQLSESIRQVQSK